MTAAAKLALWRRSEKYRKGRHDHWQRLVDQARASGQHPRQQLVDRRDHWSRLLRSAREEILELELDVPANGIDASNNNAAINFRSVYAAGYRFAWLKASEGTTYTDPYFLSDVLAARAAGLRVGAYHFLTTAPAAAQAADFAARIRAAKMKAGDILPVVDVEKNGVHGTQAGAFAAELHRLLGVRPLIYTSPGFTSWASTYGCKLWVAHYGVRKPTIPAPWKSYAAWQHSSTARVPGVTGNCDVNKTPSLKELIW